MTHDGRVLVGTLKGYDNLANVVLVDAEEPGAPAGTCQGVQIIRGDNLSAHAVSPPACSSGS